MAEEFIIAREIADVGETGQPVLALRRLRSPAKPIFFIEARPGERYRFEPQRDITAFELASIMQLFMGGGAEGWWEQAGPQIWRHFQPE